MLDGAVLALADQRRAGEDDGEHGHVIDDLHDRAEPRLVELGIEAYPERQIDRQLRNLAITLREGAHLVAHDGLDIAAAGESLAHARGIDVELDRWPPPRQQVALEVGRDVEGEGVEAGIHAGVHLGLVDHLGENKVRRVKGADDAP